eukprot:m.162327 g.162327  ORF g.162327 m.162327 type:complete len:59 (-) comp18064_c0_seq32:131-307(-)
MSTPTHVHAHKCPHPIGSLVADIAVLSSLCGGIVAHTACAAIPSPRSALEVFAMQNTA